MKSALSLQWFASSKPIRLAQLLHARVRAWEYTVLGLICLLAPDRGWPADCAPPPVGLVSWWRAETNALDQIGSNNGALLNGVSFDAGVVGQAFHFSGSSNSYVEVPDSPTLRFTNALSIEGWVKRLNASEVHGLVEKGGDWTGGQTDYELGLNDTYPGGSHFGFAFAGGWRGCAVTPDTAWHHYAAVAVSGQVDPILYIDGVPQPITYRGGPATMNLSASTRPLHIGAQLDPQTGWFYYSSTLIDELSFYNRALTAGEIQAIYNAGSAGKCAASPPSILLQPTNQLAVAGDNISFSVLATGTQPLGYQWRFNGTNLAGATASGLALSNVQLSDAGSYSVLVSNSLGTLLSSNGILTVTSQLGCIAPPAGLVSWWRGENSTADALGINNGTVAGYGTFGYGPGIVGQAFVFDGIHRDRVDVGNPPSLQLQDMTVEAWVKRADPTEVSLDDDNQDGAVGGQGGIVFGYGRNGYGFGLLNNGRMFLSKIDVDNVQSTGVITDTNWHHVAVTKVGSTAVFYIDGTPASGALPYSTIYTFIESAAVGSRGDARGGTFWGMVDEPSVYNRALSAAEIQAIYSASSAGKCAPPACAPAPAGLIGWWKGDGNGTDSTGTNNALALVNIFFTNGIVGQAFACDPESYPYGTYTGIQVADQPAYALTNSLSIEAWIRPRGDGYCVFWRGDNRPGMDPYVLSMQANNILAFQITDANGNWASVSAPLVYNQWWHVAATLDGASGRLSLYTNGSPAAQITTTVRPFGDLIPQDSPGIGIGNVNDGGNNFPFTGDIDEVSLYSRALTPSEVQSVYLVERSGKCVLPVAPVVLSPPTNLTVTAQSDAVFNVLAAGTPPLAYQWRYNGTGIAGETNPTLSLRSVGASQAGRYDVVVTNGAGAVTSAVAVLNVYVPPAPVFTLQPQTQAVLAGTDIAFTAQADDSWPITYQWYFNGNALLGATGTALSLIDVQATNGGDYTVVAANAWNGATSTVARLIITPAAPLLILQPQSAGVFVGFPAKLSVAANGTEPLAYQWQLYGTNIPGATDASYSVSNMLPANAGPYVAVVSNSAGTNSSAEALLAMAPVACWGSNAIGLMSMPIGVTNAVAVSAGAQHNLALRRDGSVVAWGASEQVNLPAGVTNMVALSAGGDHSVALKADGTVVAWGANTSGQTNVPADLSNVVSIAAGASHSLALKADGTVVAWGLGTSGQTSVPKTLTNVVGISAGSNHSIALRADGKVVAWGNNTSGQTNVPANLTDVVAIAAGAAHNLALRSDGTVVAWGSSTYSQTNVPAGLSGVIAIGAGAYHSLAVKSDGTLVAWGAGASSVPSTFPNLGQSHIPATVTNVVGVSGGQAHTLALAGDGPPFITAPPISRASYSGRRVVFRAAASGALPLRYQWQLNGNDLPCATNLVLVISNAINAGSYRLVVTNLLGTATSSAATLTLADSAPFIIAQPVGQPAYPGGQEVLQVTADGSGPFFYQWRFNGANIAGATGSSLSLSHLRLSDAGNYSVVVSNAFGEVSSAKTVLPIVQVAAWGAGTNYGSSPNYGQSIVPAGLNTAVAVAGGGYHSLALKADTKVLAWGAGISNSAVAPNYGQSMVPGSLSDVTGVAAGLYHSLAVSADGSVTAWGAGTSTSPVGIYGPYYGQGIVPASASNVLAVAASDYDSFALRSDGKVVGWGENIYSITNVPTTATNVVAIAARGSHALALRSDGTMVHWGNQAILPPSPYNYVAIAVGMNHCLGLRSDGTVVSWGGQYSVPQGLANVVDIAAGYDHSLALRTDGTVVTWGATNTYGRNLIPPGLTNAVGIACGYYNSLAVLGDGSPMIKVQPANRVALINSPTNFLAMAVGAPPLRFQWQFHGTNLPGATSSSLTLPSVQAANAGSYRVVVTNVFGAVTSSVATLTTLVPLGQALNASSLAWNVSGNAAWFGESAVTHDGVSAAQSGLITDSQTSTLQTTVTGAGTLNFWWKVSSEEWFDYLSFSIDGVKQAAISGNAGWQSQIFAMSNGRHTLSWTYAKDPSVSVGADAGWLDQVNFITAPPVITLQPLSQSGTMSNALTLTVAAAGATPLSYQWLKDGTNLNGATSAAFTIPSPTRRDSGVYQAVATNPGGSTPSSNATLVVRSPQELGSPRLLPGGGIALACGDADGGGLLPNDLSGFQAQVSSNLVNWVTLSNSLTLTNGMLQLRDPDSTNWPTRFYRIIEQ